MKFPFSKKLKEGTPKRDRKKLRQRALSTTALALVLLAAVLVNLICTDLTDRFCEEFANQFSQGQELWEQALSWLTDKGLSFAVSLLAAAVILLVGAVSIRFIVKAVGKAYAAGAADAAHNTLFADFIRNATSKICWIVLSVVVLGKLGVNIAPIIAGLGVTGFILGFAFQESLGNLASGLMKLNSAKRRFPKGKRFFTVGGRRSAAPPQKKDAGHKISS